MELKQFINKMMQSNGLRAMLPVNQGLLYPCFTICEGNLCAHFLAHGSNITPEGMVQHMPLYHVTSLYPRGSVVSIENLRFNPAFADTDFSASTLIPRRSPEEKQKAKEQMQQLTNLVNGALDSWDETGRADFDAYHEKLTQVLQPEQLQMYRKVMGW